MRRLSLPLLAILVLATLRTAGAEPQLTPPILDATGSIAAAAAAAMQGQTWWTLDGHLHTDHSHDAGVFHQQDKKPENHDTFVSDQIGEVEREQLDAITLTDHRTYDQAYDPTYRSTKLLLDGEEWGGYPHATAWGITEVLDQGAAEVPVNVCGVARAAFEVRAEDAIYGVAHPEDGRRDCITAQTLKDVPIDHLEAFRYPHTSFWVKNIQAGHRLNPVTGSDNHFRQLYGSDGGPGASTTFILARDLTKASLVDAVRAGRVFSSTRALGPRLTSFLDANGDGTFDALTGGGVTPTGPTVRVAFRVQNGPGHWLEVLNDKDVTVAQWPVAGVDSTYAYDLPATSAYYRAQLTGEPVQRVSGGQGHDYFAYYDTLRVLSAPLYLSPATPVENGTQMTAAGDATRVSGAVPYAGAADVARDGNVVHAVWQERHAPVYAIAYARSDDAGATWSEPQIITDPNEEGRLPSIAVYGSHVVVAYESTARGVGESAIAVRTSDGGVFSGRNIVSRNRAERPVAAASANADHVAFMEMTPEGFAIKYVRGAGGMFGAAVQLSHGRARDGGLAQWAIPPRPITHIPAAVHPAIAVQGARVAVAWEDDREDPTPLRNGTPDDWGIYLTTSADNGARWSTDARISPRHDRKPFDAAKPEDMEGNPARHADLLYASDGSLYAAWQDRNAPGGFTILTERSLDNGATWSALATASAVTSELAYRPKLAEIAGGVRVVWQASAGARWNLRAASSTDNAATFTPEAAFTTGSGYAGFPSVAGDVVMWTGERGGAYGVFSARA